MGLSSALHAAVSGLSLTNRRLAVASQNIANAKIDGYTLKNVVGVENVNSTTNTSTVRSSEVQRQLDTSLQGAFWNSLSDASYAETFNQTAKRLDTLFGRVGDNSSLPSLTTALTNALTELGLDPSSPSAQSGVTRAADNIAKQINRNAEDVQDLRRQTDAQIGDDLDDVNRILKNVDDLEKQIIKERSAGRTTASLQDEMDRQLTELTAKMDVEITRSADDNLRISTRSGQTLYDDEVAQLQYLPSPTLAPGIEGNPVQVVTPAGLTMDLSGSDIRGGSLGALLTLRDETLPEAQNMLDELASQMSVALSRQTAVGSAADDGVVPATKTGLSVPTDSLQSPGDRIELEFTSVSGEKRSVSFIAVRDSSLLPLSSEATANPNDIVHGLVIPADPGALQSQISGALGGGFDVSVSGSGDLKILTPAVGASATVTSLDVKSTRTAVVVDGGELPLFMDSASGGKPYTSSLENGGQKLGFAQRIVVNPAVMDNPSVIAGPPHTQDSTRANLLKDRLNKAEYTFFPSSGVGTKGAPFVGSISEFSTEVVLLQSKNASAAATHATTTSTVKNISQAAYENSYQVDVDQELVKITELENAYAANARVLSAVNEMLDDLMSVV